MSDWIRGYMVGTLILWAAVCAYNHEAKSAPWWSATLAGLFAGSAGALAVRKDKS